MWFFEVAILEITIRYLNLYGRFCPYNPPYKPGEKISTPLFLEDKNIFQKSASVVVGGISLELRPRIGGRFLKNVLIFEKKEVQIFFPDLYGGLYGQNLPYKFKKSYGDFQNRNFEKPIELLVPGQIWDWIGDPGQILV